MIRLGMRNTIESPSLENGFRIDNLNRFISDNRTLPPKKGQAWNYAVFLENMYKPNELYPNNVIYNFQDVRRQYDFNTDVAYKLKESPYEALNKAKQEYMDAVEAAKEAPITLPFIDKIEELALRESLEQFNVPEQVREQFLNFENNLKTLQLPEEVKKSMRAIAYMDFLRSQEIQPVEVVDPTTGEVMFKSATMAGAVDKSASTGFPSIVKESIRMTPKELMGAQMARRMGMPYLTSSQARAMFGSSEPVQPVKSTYGDRKDEKGSVRVVRDESDDEDVASASVASVASSASAPSAPVQITREETVPQTVPPQPKPEERKRVRDAWEIPQQKLDESDEEDTPSTRPTKVRETQRRGSEESTGWFGGLGGWFGRGAGRESEVEQPADPYKKAVDDAIKAIDEMRGSRKDLYNNYVKILPAGYGNVGKFSGGTPPTKVSTAFKQIISNSIVSPLIEPVRKAMSNKYKRELKNVTNFDAVHELIATMIERKMFDNVSK